MYSFNTRRTVFYSYYYNLWSQNSYRGMEFLSQYNMSQKPNSFTQNHLEEGVQRTLTHVRTSPYTWTSHHIVRNKNTVPQIKIHAHSVCLIHNNNSYKNTILYILNTYGGTFSTFSVSQKNRVYSHRVTSELSYNHTKNPALTESYHTNQLNRGNM